MPSVSPSLSSGSIAAGAPFAEDPGDVLLSRILDGQLADLDRLHPAVAEIFAQQRSQSRQRGDEEIADQQPARHVAVEAVPGQGPSAGAGRSRDVLPKPG